MSKSTEAIDEAAAEWVVRLASDQRTHADEQAFRAWLEESPDHAQAYADCMALWDDVGDIVATDEGRRALKRLRAPVHITRRISRRFVIFGGLGLALIIVASVVGPLLFGGIQTFQTVLGEQRRIRLSDGSGVLLNTDTRLRVKFVGSQRLVFLDRGQAFFEVVKDKTRPFRVFAGHDEVRALGTAFEVRRLGNEIQVTLEEGQVAIYRSADGASRTLTANPGAPVSLPISSSSEMSAPVAILSPGQQAILEPAEPVAVHLVDLGKSQAWRYGRMILDNALLGDVISDLNRYGGVQIVLADPKLAEIRVSGVFHTGRPEDFVKSITAAFPIQVARRDAGTILLSSR
jgi:transmembrane sensor